MDSPKDRPVRKSVPVQRVIDDPAALAWAARIFRIARERRKALQGTADEATEQKAA